jgi:glycosyltransferase involved in cell wall biosynthesis
MKEPGARLLIICHDVVATQMAGPGIRAYHLARVLARHLPTTLAVPNPPSPELPAPGYAMVEYDLSNWSSLAPLVAEAEICLLACDTLNGFPEIAGCAPYLVIDGYDPLLPEWLALHAQHNPASVAGPWRERWTQIARQYAVGDFYLCASERQRDWWLGLLEAQGRINPYTYAADPSLRRLVDLVPYGLDGKRPQRRQAMVKGIWDGIGIDDKVLLWGGGLWPWLDPLTAIRAVHRIWQQRQDVKLIFPGTRHPNPGMSTITTHVEEARQLAADLGLLERAVFFGDWVSYTAWDDLLLDCDLALTLHFDTVETRLAFRSRVFEYIRAELPIVATEGDATSELVARFGIGEVTPYQADEQVAAAILRLLGQPKDNFGAAFAHARSQLTWERAAEPLIRYCRQPWRAADKAPLADQLSGRFMPSAPPPMNGEHDETAALADTVRRQAEVIAGYERGRFIRTMHKLDEIKRFFLRS